jgi:hypothetical protein
MLRAFHERVWRRLPKRWRRTVLVSATSLLSPRAAVAARPAFPIIVAGAFRTRARRLLAPIHVLD